jgi:hypothetical protein
MTPSTKSLDRAASDVSNQIMQVVDDAYLRTGFTLEDWKELYGSKNLSQVIEKIIDQSRVCRICARQHKKTWKDKHS